MEASALRAPALARRPLSRPLLRLRSDEQLVALFRAGSEDAFSAMHDRYRQRLFAYARQMLSVGSRADAEDVLQDVFVRAYGALRADARDVNLRARLYRVAHNRCIDHLRRPAPPAAEIFELSRTPLQDPIETAQRREDLRRLVADVGRLPAQQRSALLMREIDGLTYLDIAAALDVTLPAVKSLLVRARMGLVEAIEAREIDCAVIREDLLSAYDRGVKASGRTKRHLRECDGCSEYRGALRDIRRSFASLSPIVGFTPLALLAKAAGLGGGGGAGGVGAGGGATVGAVTAGKVAVVACGAALATGTVAEVRHRMADGPAPAKVTVRKQTPVAAAPTASSAAAPAQVREPAARSAPAAPRKSVPTAPRRAAPVAAVLGAFKPVERSAPPPDPGEKPAADPVTRTTGGTTAPREAEAIVVAPIEPVASEVPIAATPVATPDPVDPGATATPPAGGPPPEH